MLETPRKGNYAGRRHCFRDHFRPVSLLQNAITPLLVEHTGYCASPMMISPLNSVADSLTRNHLFATLYLERVSRSSYGLRLGACMKT